MKRVKMYCLVLAVIFMSISICSVVDAQDSTLSVAPGASNAQAAEISPTIYGLKQGDTLVLEEGYYQISGQAYLQDNNITIKGAGKDKTFIYVKSQDAGWGVTITGANCVLQDFTLERSTQPNNAAAIKVMGGNDTSIKNVKTIGGYYGIDVNPSVKTVIDGCEFTKTSKGSIGIGCESSERTTVTIQNTTTRQAGWLADIAINDKDSYGCSTVILGKGNVFTNGQFYTENYAKSDFVIDKTTFPQYATTEVGKMKAYVEIPTIALNATQGSLEVGKKKTISGIISPANDVQGITWQSSNPNIASVSNTGEITAISSGEVEIKAIAGKATAIYQLTVFKVDISVPDVDLLKPTDIVDVGIIDLASKETINGTSNQIIEAIINSEAVDSAIISTDTVDKIKMALENGATISTKVETKVVDEKTIDTKEKEEITKSIQSIVSENRTIAKLAQYLDIDIVLQAQKDGESETLGEIYQLRDTIEFTVAIPTELKKANREFYVVRMHDGVSTILTTIKNEDGTISFETNQFSTYALIYNDKVEAVVPTPPTDKEDPILPDTPKVPSATLPEITPLVPVDTNANKNVLKDSSNQKKMYPDTSDTAWVSEYFMLMMLSLVGIIKVFKK